MMFLSSVAACGGGTEGGDGGGGPTPVGPTASFVRSPTSGTPPLTVQFTDTSAPGSAAITAWLWDFGDGGSSTAQNPTHVYTSAATYSPTLRVTTSVGSDVSDAGTGAVVVSAPLPARIVDTIGVTPNSPALPEPSVFGQVLPEYSEERLVAQSPVREFRPVMSQVYLTSWTGNLGVNDCRIGAGLDQIPEPASPTQGFRTTIPRRNTTYLYSWKYSEYGDSDPWGSFPRVLLVGVFNSPGHPDHGKSYRLGSFARWESCEEMKPFLQDWYTTYVISYNHQIADWPVLRHYRVWKKIGNFNITGLSGVSQALAWTTGVARTTAWEFTASLTATVGAEGPTTYGELSATVSTTMGESVTFSSQEQVTETFTANPTVHPEYNLQYSVWVLVDRYRVERSATGPRPNRWSDPNYELGANTFEFEVQSRTDKAIQSAWFLRP